MKVSVFVQSIVRGPVGVVVTATNGGTEGPPLVKFQAPTADVEKIYVGQRLSLQVGPPEEEPDPNLVDELARVRRDYGALQAEYGRVTGALADDIARLTEENDILKGGKA